MLCLSGHDPSGGAGIQADIETLNSLGQPCASLITCLTVQDSRNLTDMRPVETELFKAQVEALLTDLRIAAIKIGALGNREIAEITVGLIKRLRTSQPNIPVVIDPVIAAGGGGKLADQGVIDCLREQILPLATVATPNRAELEQLGKPAQLLASGCQWLLLTTTDSSNDTQIQHPLYGPDNQLHMFTVPRLPGNFHGSGCTLASAVAAFLAQGYPCPQAIERALAFTEDCLERARLLGQGQAFPNRSPS